MNTERTLTVWLADDARHWDPPAVLLRDVLAIPTMHAPAPRPWSSRMVLVIVGILLLLALIASAVILGALNDRRLETTVESPLPSSSLPAAVNMTSPAPATPVTAPTLAVGTPDATQPIRSPDTSGPLTADNGLVVVWYSFFCPVGRQATVTNRVLITAISNCPTKLPSSVLWSSDAPGQWNNSPQIDQVMAVGFVNETYVGNDVNDSHPFADFANVYGRPSPIQPTSLPTEGDGARVNGLAYVTGTGYLAVGADSQPGNAVPQVVIWKGQDLYGAGWAEAPGPPDAASLIDVAPSDHSFVVLGDRASDAAPMVWHFDANGWSSGVALPGATQTPDVQLIDEDTALDPSHLWTGLSGGTPTVTMFPAGYSMASLVHVADGYIAVGAPDDGSAKDAVLVSTDGSAWHLAAFNPDFSRFRINVLVETSSEVIGLGGAQFVGPNTVAAYRLQ